MIPLIIIFFNIQQLPRFIPLIFKSPFPIQPPFAGILPPMIEIAVKPAFYSSHPPQPTGPHPPSPPDLAHP
ncbi:alanine:cation symporter family protein, partial [Staphylococcus saprophyticus]|uniref:alanine:cation symporter family protein n=1 Tax=Staphylococcus saprophyticus TaxID=29385 RepID=UPI00370422A2